MIDFNGILKSKLFKFSIVIFIAVTLGWNFYKKNKKEVKQVVFMYSEYTDEEIKEMDSKLKEEKRKSIEKAIPDRYKKKKWYSKKEQEYKEKLELIRKQKREEIIKKYSMPAVPQKQYTQEEKVKMIKLVAERTEANFKYMELLKKEYERKKKNGKISYGKRVKSHDYVYVSVKPIANFKEAKDKIKVEKIDFVILVDAEKTKKFNEKLIGKKINDVVELEIEDFLSEERIRVLHNGFMYADLNAKQLIKMYPYLEKTPIKNVSNNVRFKMQTTILDILDKNFIEKHNVKDRTFDYNTWE